MANSRTISSLSDASYALSDYSDGSAPQQPSTDILSATSGGHARSQKTSRDASAGDTPNRDSTLSASDVSRRPKNQGLDLMTRLYAKPQDSEVVKTIQARHPQPPTSPKTGQHRGPRPPSGKNQGSPSRAFRTTLFRRDHARIQQKLQRRDTAEEKTMLGMLQRRPSIEKLAKLGMCGDKEEDAQSDMSADSASDFMLRDDVSSVSATSTKGLDQMRSRDENQNPVNKDPVTKEEEKSVMFGRVDLESTPSFLHQDAAPPRITPSPVKSTTRIRSGNVASRADPSIVLNYMKKNKYDDTAASDSMGYMTTDIESTDETFSWVEPEDDDFVHCLVEMRQKLGWVTELPKHSPGVREAMTKLSNTPTTAGDNTDEAIKKDDGHFIYALPRKLAFHPARYNPYDLQVVSPNTARESKVFYTATASSVTMNVQSSRGESNSSTPALQWLWERRLYFMINEIPVFVKFRAWKAFNIWKINVRNKKNTINQGTMYKQLFVANEILQGCLLHVRGLCETASSSATGYGTGDSAITLVNLDKTTTLTLKEFIDQQILAKKKALKKLAALRKKVVDIVWESCATVAEMEGVTHGIRSEGKSAKVQIQDVKESKRAAEEPVKRMVKTAYGEMPLYEKKETENTADKKPMYAQISEWRKVLTRLSYFLRSVDYLILELLRRIVITSTRDLLNFLIASFHIGNQLDDGDDDDDTIGSVDSDDETVSRVPRSQTENFMVLERPDSASTDVSSIIDGSVLSSENSALTSVSSQAKRPMKSKRKSFHAMPLTLGYKTPHFNFDKPESLVAPPDIDEVLEEVKKLDEIEIMAQPVFSLQLVLHVPPVSRASESRVQAGARKETEDKEDNKLNQDRTGTMAQKKVQFTADTAAQETTDEDDEEENESGYSDSEVSGGSSESDQEDAQVENRFSSVNDRLSHAGSGKDSGKCVQVKLSPDVVAFKNGVRGIIASFEIAIGEVPSMLKEPKLSVFYSPPKYDLRLNYDEEVREEEEEVRRPWPDVELLLGEDPEYQSLLREIMSYMDACMQEVSLYSADFDKYCFMVEKALRVDVAGSMARKMWTTEEFHHVLYQHTDQLHHINHMPRLRRIGFVEVQSERFCKACLPYPDNILKAVCQQMPSVANKRNEDLLNIIKGASKKLDLSPSTVEEFVEHLSFLGRMSSEIQALEKEFGIVSKLFTIAKDFEVTIEPEDFALYQTLAPSFQHLKTTILFCEAKKDENIRKFTKDLEGLVHSIRYKLVDLRNKVCHPMLLNNDTMAMTALEHMKSLTDEITSLSAKARSYANYQDRFGSSLATAKKNYSEEYLLEHSGDAASAQTVQAELAEIERDLTLRRLLWESQEEWTKLVDDWTSTAFDSLNVDNLQKNVSRFTQTVYMLEKGLPSNEVVPKLKEVVLHFKQGMPVITSLRNPSLKKRHWDAIEKIIGRSLKREKSFTLGNLIDMNIFKHKEQIQDTSTTASNEATLEIMLNKVADLWRHTDFRLVVHSTRDTHIIAAADDIMAMLEESQVTVGTIRGSRYVTPIKGTVEDWERRLQLFARTLDEWMTCQRNWLYLEQIFSTPDIQRQLPNEAKLFTGVDKNWKDIMRRTEDRPNALKAATAPGVLEMLQAANTSLEKIQKCLEDYLETKRLVFPRFYFLSNEELLDILAQSKNPDAVQPHLGKCFGNIESLEICQVPRQPPTVKTIRSAEGEVVPMPKNVRARGPVEQWLGRVETGMYDTVKKHLKMGLQDIVGIDHGVWVLKHPGQVVLTVDQILFNRNVTSCFAAFEPVKCLGVVKEKVVATLNKLAGLVLRPLLPHQRMSIEALLTVDVHNRDVLTQLIHSRVEKPESFDWKRQLRYEWDEQSNNCNVLQGSNSFHYGYEYLGCSPRLVITPLTDRCYLTLTGALGLHLGGSPAGPAGTGKTETVKDLAKSMGKQCVVFNCSEGLDYKMLGKFFSGMAQSGSWCCFDEFNRIDVEVLSVVAQQIHTIKTAKDQMAPRFLFEGRDIRLNMTCGVFITMNPTYAGRVELPDNLKSLFRPVAMMVPDYALIAEIMLFSEGFTAAKSLSRKIVNLYQLASTQLSQQDHYDFGMRAIKSVLVMAGSLKRQFQLREKGAPKQLDEEDEAHILIHALTDANLPKFLAEDVPLFETIMEDLFPGISAPKQDQAVLEKAISMSIRDQHLQSWPHQIEKVKQLYSQILVRHGVMLVGPTGGGKSTIRTILQRALVLLPTINLDREDSNHIKPQGLAANRAKKGHMEVFSINPKCVKLGELYGETDPNTFEWTDGLIATATRKFAKDLTVSTQDDRRPDTMLTSYSERAGSAVTNETMTPEPPDTPSGEDFASHNQLDTMAMENHGERIPRDWRWLIMDGPVDTLWVENLNTVLDDSKVLCLANGERISLGPGMRLVFEVDDLSQASPATISRCAMVYMDPVDLGWRPYVKTWLSRLSKSRPEFPDSGKEHLEALFEHAVDRGLAFAALHKRFQLIPAPDMSFVVSLCSILSAYIEFLGKNGGFGLADKVNRPSSTESHKSSESRSSSKTGSHSRSGSREKSRSRGSRRKKARQKELATIREKENRRALSGGPQLYLEKNPGELFSLLGKLFVFAYTWSFGGNFNLSDTQEDDSATPRSTNQKGPPEINIGDEFDNMCRELFEIEPPLGVRMPSSSKNIFSFFVDMDSGGFIPWEQLVPSTRSLIDRGAVITIGETVGVSGMEQDKSHRQEDKIVSTVDTVRYSFLMSLLILHGTPVLLTGNSGVGKSAIIKDMLSRLGQDGGTSTTGSSILGQVLNYTDKNKVMLDTISTLTQGIGRNDNNASGGVDSDFDILMGSSSKARFQTGIISSMIQFSAQTSAARTQMQIMLKLIKKGRDILGAPKNRKVVVFIDDLNMPAPEEYGAQPPLELLRQYLDLGGFYDTRKLAWKDINDVTLIAACGPPGGGRNPVSQRLLKHFSMLCLPQPSNTSLQHIYQVKLGKFFQEGDFMPEVKECMFPLVQASIAVYNKMCSAMRPTPAKMHYTFNIRDLSAVISGLLQADESIIMNGDGVAQLLAHEATRVFHDRLVDDSDRATFFKILSDDLHNFFKVKWTPEKLMEEPVLFGDFFGVNEGHAGRVYKPISDLNKLAQIMEEFRMRQTMGGGEQAKNEVFFKEAVEHVTRAARVFRQPGGHMMLVGLDGTGKATTVQLACLISGCQLHRLSLTRGYNGQDFREDLKVIYKKAGVEGEKIIFLLTDGDIVKESFLEDINCILNSGEVPDLFDNEEMDGICVELRQVAAQAGIPDTRTDVYNFFIKRVTRNLHIVLTMSPAGSKFRQRCRMNPSLINCCTIDWYEVWSEAAMLSVAKVYFHNLDFTSDPSHNKQDLKDSVGRVCVKIHNSVSVMSKAFWEEMRRHFYITPSSYIELIRIYSSILRANKKECEGNRHRLIVGLARLSEANALVGTMQEELVALGPKIEEKAKDTELLLAQLEKDQEAVDQVREIVQKEEAIMKKETQVVQDYADECQRDLASVLPALQSAIDALDSLDKADISEIRVYLKPPEIVKMVMSAVCTLLMEKPDWATAKQVLGDASFLKNLVQFDKNNVPEKVFVKLRRYSQHPDFNPEKVGQVSLACRSMCQWVLALEHYHEVFKMAKPKQKKVEEAREALGMAQENLAKKQASLKKIQEHLGMLQQQYTDSVNQRESLKERKVLTGVRLKRASVLIAALSDERVRWSESVSELDTKLHGLVGDTLVSSAAVVYLGAFTAKYRKEALAQWVKDCQEAQIPISKKYDMVNHMVYPTKVLRWHNEGLPKDTHSTENAILVSKAYRWPLIIDPQGQAMRWIKGMEGEKLKVLRSSDPNYMRTMERAIRLGEPVLLKEVTEDLDPSLSPILRRETFSRGGHQVMRLGDTEIEYNENFRLYMTTSMSNPHYLPAVCIQVTIINFIVTFEGLQEQLLSSVVKQERPLLEKERSQLLTNIAGDLQMLRDLEDKTLNLLQNTQGHILDDEDLVQTLQQSKAMSEEVHKRVAKSEVTEKQLNQARQRYLPVATRGAVLYFIVADLANVDVMYQFSLDWFESLFSTCIDYQNQSALLAGNSFPQNPLTGTLRPSEARSSPDLAKNREQARVDSANLRRHLLEMIDRLTSEVYRIVSMGLFSNHQLMFSFMLCSSIMRAAGKYSQQAEEGYSEGHIGKISEMDWVVFLQGGIMASMMDETLLEVHDGLSPMQRLEVQAKGTSVPRPRWISDSMWRQCQHLEETTQGFETLCYSILNHPLQWSVFADSDRPYHLMEVKFNTKAQDKVTEKEIFRWELLPSFLRLLLIKVLRPSALTAAIFNFVEDQMGSKFVKAGTYDLREVLEESTAKQPLVFILSPGSDPAGQLLRFAKDIRGSTLHLDMISLGRGQGPKAEELIAKAQILKGRWVFLQNCHLAASWMPRLQAIVDNFNRPNSDVDPQFRLWLSSKPDKCFPVSVLQTGIKMTVENPQGLKGKLLQSFSSTGKGALSERTYEDAGASPEWKPLLFGLCFFNAVLHERKKYGTLGWNLSYEFNDSDMEVSMLMLNNLLSEHEEVPWPALNYLTGEVTFGGRVTDDKDRRILQSLLRQYYSPEAVQPGYNYSPDGVYHPPSQDSSYSDVRKYIESLPAISTPQIFGMNDNAEKAFLEDQSKELIDSIISIQPRLATSLIGSKKTNDQIILDVAVDIMKNLPEAMEENPEDRDPGVTPRAPQSTLAQVLTRLSSRRDKRKELGEEAGRETPALDEMNTVTQSALLTVLRQEMDRFDRLLDLIHKSLKALRLAVKGEVVMSESLEEAYTALLKQRVPAQWKQYSYESRKALGSWVQDLIQRVEFFSQWADLIVQKAEKAFRSLQNYNRAGAAAAAAAEDTTEQPKLQDQPRSFWLSAFFFPQGFLTGVLQNHARKMGVSVDSLTFSFEVITGREDTDDTLNDLKHKAEVKRKAFQGGASPLDGVLVFGLYLDGARWSPQEQVLEDSLPGHRFCHLPEIHFQPVMGGESASSPGASPSPQAGIESEEGGTQPSSDLHTYKCPLYRTSARAGTLSSTGHSTNFVTAIDLPSNHKPDFWVLRGVAALTQLDD